MYIKIQKNMIFFRANIVYLDFFFKFTVYGLKYHISILRHIFIWIIVLPIQPPEFIASHEGRTATTAIVDLYRPLIIIIKLLIVLCLVLQRTCSFQRDNSRCLLQTMLLFKSYLLGSSATFSVTKQPLFVSTLQSVPNLKI